MRYIYPPRPENKIPAGSLETFENMGLYLGQPKFNGSSMEIYTDGSDLTLMNRHKESMACKMDKSELLALHRGSGEMILCGEYMNKNQKDETGNYWNIKYVIWDILVYEDNHLVGSTFKERFKLLRNLYPNNIIKPYLHGISENCFRVDAITSGFKRVFDDIIQYAMYEGLVLKRIDGKLENGTSANNNTRTQLKCRKPTKNYNF